MYLQIFIFFLCHWTKLIVIFILFYHPMNPLHIQDTIIVFMQWTMFISYLYNLQNPYILLFSAYVLLVKTSLWFFIIFFIRGMELCFGFSSSNWSHPFSFFFEIYFTLVSLECVTLSMQAIRHAIVFCTLVDHYLYFLSNVINKNNRL